MRADARLQSYLVCLDVVESNGNSPLTIVCPFWKVGVSRFPATIPLTVYAQLANARGSYAVSLALMSGSGTPVWEAHPPVTLVHHRPAEYHTLWIRRIPVEFPAAGRYQLALLLNDEVAGEHALAAWQSSDPTPKFQLN